MGRSDKIRLKNTTPLEKSVAISLFHIIIPVHRGNWGQFPYLVIQYFNSKNVYKGKSIAMGLEL